jgi:uroporphyrin-3 C-methyltransferase
VVDIESSLRLAQQQAQLTGSLEPLVGALKNAQQRIGPPSRVMPVQRAIGATWSASACQRGRHLGLVRSDDLVRQVDELPLANAVASSHPPAACRPSRPTPRPTPAGRTPVPTQQPSRGSMKPRVWCA